MLRIFVPRLGVKRGIQYHLAEVCHGLRTAPQPGFWTQLPSLASGHRKEPKVKLLLVTDCWKPYISGYVRTFSTVVDLIRDKGNEVDLITPYMFHTLPFPFYPEFRVPLLVRRKVARLIEESQPDAMHLGAEGPLGAAARRWCLRNSYPFTTSYTTKMPEHMNKWFGLPVAVGYRYLRRFHAPANAVMVSTPSVKRELDARGFKNMVHWSRGVDLALFRPRPKEFLTDQRPISMYVGRVAKEKNIPAFLDLDLPGTKYVIGSGPMLKSLRKKYPHVRFAGSQTGEQLAQYYAAADVVVFPSLLDTFGLVMLEALACGTPVAAYPVTGPIDVVGDCEAAALDEDLGRAVRQALIVDRSRCRPYAERFSWEESAQQFLSNLHPQPLSSDAQPHRALKRGEKQHA